MKVGLRPNIFCHNLQRMIGLEHGVCYSYNMIGNPVNFGQEIRRDELEWVDNPGEHTALELILDLGGLYHTWAHTVNSG